jgi:hypothetical protein
MEDEPHSVATGISTTSYDWLGVVEPVIRTGGWPVIVDDGLLLQANEIAPVTRTSTSTPRAPPVSQA